MTNTTNTTEQTTTTTQQAAAASDKPFATVDEMTLELERTIAVAKRRHEDARAKFLADATNDPANAVTWWAKEAVATQIEHKAWQQIERDLAEHGPAAALANALDEYQSGVRDFFGRSATCQFANAVDRAKAEAFMRLAGHLTVLKRFLGC